MGALPVIWVNSYVYATEIFEPKWRSMFIGLFEIPIGYYIFGLIGYLNRTWTGIHIWVGIATGLTIPLYFLLPESPRWLSQNGFEEDAFKVLLKMAKINGRKLDDNDKLNMRSLVKALAEESHQTEDKLRPWDMFRKGHFVKSCILIFGWITSCISFYALSLNSTSLSGDIFENYFLARTSGFVTAALVLIFVNWIGRRISFVISHQVLGFSCIILAFIPKEYVTAVLVVYLIATTIASVSKYFVKLKLCFRKTISRFFFSFFSRFHDHLSNHNGIVSNKFEVTGSWISFNDFTNFLCMCTSTWTFSKVLQTLANVDHRGANSHFRNFGLIFA